MSESQPSSQPPKPSVKGSKTNPLDPLAKASRWRRWTGFTALAILLLALIFRIALIWITPMVLRHVAGQYGLQCRFTRLELSLLGGDVGIWHLELTPLSDSAGAPGGGAQDKPVLQAGYCRAHISTWELLHGRIFAWRLEADGAEIDLERQPDGSIPLLDRFLKAGAAAAPAQTANAGASTGESGVGGAIPRQLQPPLVIEALRIERMRAHLHDRSVTPELTSQLLLDIRLSDLGLPGRPVSFEVNFSADPVLDSLLLDGQCLIEDRTMVSNIELDVRGLRLRPAAGYLRPLGLRPVANELSMRTHIHISLALPTPPATGMTGMVQVDKVSLTADGQEALGLDQLTLGPIDVQANAINLGKLLVEGARVNASRSVDSTLRVAGVDLVPVESGPAAATQATTAKADAQTEPDISSASPPQPLNAPTQPASSPEAAPSTHFRLGLQEVAIEHARASFRDEAISPVTEMAINVDELTGRTTSPDVTGPDLALDLAGTMRLPGLVRAAHLTGQAHPFANPRSAQIQITAEGIKPDVLRPYLEHAGVISDLQDAGLKCNISAAFASGPHGRITTDFRLSDLRLQDQGSDLFTLDDLDLSGFTLDPNSPWIAVKSIDILGPTMEAQRQPSGALAMLGFHTAPPSASIPASLPAPPESPAENPTTQAAPATLPWHFPKLSLGRFSWTQVHLRLADHTVTPATNLDLADFQAKASDLAIDLDLDPTPFPSKTGTFSAQLAAQGWAKKFSIEGMINPQPGEMLASLQVAGQGLSALPLAPYLRNMGIDPTLQDGAVHLRADLHLTRVLHGVNAALTLRDLSYTDGPHELLAADLVRLNDVVIHPGAIEIGDVGIDRPRASLARDEDGSLLLGGLRLRRAAPAQPNVGTPSSNAPAANFSLAWHPPFVTTLKSVNVSHASLEWSDSMVKPVVKTTLTAGVDLHDLTLGQSAPPGDFRVTAGLAGAIDSLSLAGHISLSDTGPSVHLAVAAAGVRAGPLASYLPPGVRLISRNAVIKADIDALWIQNPDGGNQGYFKLANFDWREADAAHPVSQPAASAFAASDSHDTATQPPAGPLPLSIGNAGIIVSRLDIPHGIVAIQEVTLSDAHVAVRSAKDGSLEAAGLALVPVPEAAPAATTPSPSDPPSLPTASPASKSIRNPKSQILAALARRQSLPLVTINKIDLNLAELNVADQSGSSPRQVRCSNLRLHNLQPIQCLGPHTGQLPPIKMELMTAIDDIARSSTLTMDLSPFGDEIKASANLAVDGIQGPGLLALLGNPGSQVDGSGLQQGQLTAKCFVGLKLDRRSPLDFSLARGFDATIAVHDLQLRQQPDSPIEWSIQEIQLENVRVAPKFRKIAARSLEIDQIVARVAREKDGIHVLGCVYKLPAAGKPGVASTRPAKTAARPPATSSTARPIPTSQPAPPPPSSSSPVVSAASPARSHFDFSIHRLVISGIDAQIDDHTVKPPLRIPLNDLDIEVHDFTTLAFYEDRQMHYTLVVNAGPVALPRIIDDSDAGGGAKQPAKPVMEERDLFTQIISNGRFSLYPRPHGWAEGSINGLELTAFSGEAAQAGVGVGAGTFDASGHVHIKDDGTGDVDSRLVLSDLRVSEDPNGKLSQALQLHGSLDFIISTLEDTNGAITIPFNFSITPGRSLYADAYSALPGAITNVLTTALANAPLKSVQAFTGLFGLDLFSHKPKPMAPMVLAFAPGSTLIDGTAKVQIDTLASLLNDDKHLQFNVAHAFGGGDIALAALRANPSSEDCLSLLAQLRQKRDDLEQLRSDVAGQARGQLASRFQADVADATLARLRAIERELAQTDDAIDNVGSLLRHASPSLQARRTRAAALEIAHQRMLAVRSALEAAGVWRLESRVIFESPRYPPSPTTSQDLGNAGGSVTVTQVNVR